MNLLRRRMRKYYKDSVKKGTKLTEIGKLSLKMLGPMSSPRLKAKAAETRHLVDLCPALCE
eukprot:8308540-Alexandrium_andersonii.AAC.1